MCNVQRAPSGCPLFSLPEGGIIHPVMRGKLSILSTELTESLKFGFWVFTQLIFGPCCPMNQLNKNLNIA